MSDSRSSIPVYPPSPVDLLLSACPFLADHQDIDFNNGPTCVFGDVAQLLRSGALDPDEEHQVFEFFNELAEHGDVEAREVLATGALELMNDDAASQRLARANLRGKALELVEEMRTYWGQPDYGAGA